MNRTEARARWARIAAGDLEHPQSDGVDLHAWIRQVAQDLIFADDEAAEGRPAKVLRAVGLDGKHDGYADLRAFVTGPMWDFSKLDDGGNPVTESKGSDVRLMLDQARALGLLKGKAEDDEKLLQLMRDLRTGRR